MTPVREGKSATALSGALQDLEQGRAVFAERASFALPDADDGPPFTPAGRDHLWDLFEGPDHAILTGSVRRVAN